MPMSDNNCFMLCTSLPLSDRNKLIQLLSCAICSIEKDDEVQAFAALARGIGELPPLSPEQTAQLMHFGFHLAGRHTPESPVPHIPVDIPAAFPEVISFDAFVLAPFKTNWGGWFTDATAQLLFAPGSDAMKLYKALQTCPGQPVKATRLIHGKLQQLPVGGHIYLQPDPTCTALNGQEDNPPALLSSRNEFMKFVGLTNSGHLWEMLKWQSFEHGGAEWAERRGMEYLHNLDGTHCVTNCKQDHTHKTRWAHRQQYKGWAGMFADVGLVDAVALPQPAASQPQFQICKKRVNHEQPLQDSPKRHCNLDASGGSEGPSPDFTVSDIVVDLADFLGLYCCYKHQ